MSIVSALPSRPLTADEINQIRVRDDVEALTTIGTTSIHNRHNDRKRKIASMVVLTEGTAYALEYEDFEWSKEVLQRNADRRDQLQRALDQLDKR